MNERHNPNLLCEKVPVVDSVNFLRIGIHATILGFFASSSDLHLSSLLPYRRREMRVRAEPQIRS
jgi:hypothetical protein